MAGGSCEESDQIFERVAQVLSEQFSMVGPDGQQTTREPLLQGLRVAYGSRPELGIWIKAFQSHHQEGGLIVATYEEWQEAETTTRLSTVVFHHAPDMPNQVTWLHVPETWKG